MPKTWDWHSKKVLGYVAPVTYTNEVYVTANIIQEWIDQGKTDYQIGLIYNGGEIKVKKGTNKFGIRYDSGAYAKKLLINIAYIAEAGE